MFDGLTEMQQIKLLGLIAWLGPAVIGIVVCAFIGMKKDVDGVLFMLVLWPVALIAGTIYGILWFIPSRLGTLYRNWRHDRKYPIATRAMKRVRELRRKKRVELPRSVVHKDGR